MPKVIHNTIKLIILLYNICTPLATAAIMELRYTFTFSIIVTTIETNPISTKSNNLFIYS